MTTGPVPPSIGEVWSVVEPIKEPTARLYGYDAQTSLHLLQRLHKVTEGPIVLDFPVGQSVDRATVRSVTRDGGSFWHTFDGEPVGDAWYFTPAAMEVACYRTGWAVVPIALGKLRLTSAIAGETAP